MAGVQAHMKSFFPLQGSGHCSPALLEDLSLHNPDFDRRIPPAYDILRDNPVRFTRGQPNLGSWLLPQTCRHEFLGKPRQSLLPTVDELPNAETKWSLAAICWKCRVHLHLKIDYSDDWQSGPCPNSENPLHHFVRAEWREGVEKRSWEHAMLGSESDIVVFQCSAQTCSAILTVRYTPQQLSTDMIHTLIDPGQIRQRTEAAFQANEGNTLGMKPPSAFDVLSDLRIYMTNCWNTGQQSKRDIKMNNRRFIVRFGPNGDACQDLLEFLRFKRDDVEQAWHVPQPNSSDTIPVRDPVNVFLDDVEHELHALMLSRPREEAVGHKDLDPGIPAIKEMRRLLSAQNYDTVLFHRGKANDPAARPPPFIGLGIVPDVADQIVRYAYQRQIAHDPVNMPFYFEFLRSIALERRSEALDIEVSVEESKGRFTASALQNAFAAFSIGEHDNFDDDHILGLFSSRVMDMPAQESELRNHLRIIGTFRNSSKVLAVANNIMDNHEQALQFLGADATVSDDSITALYTVKINEGTAYEEQAKKAVRLIADHRNSRLLKRWIDSGFAGDLSMEPADGYQALNIDDRQLEDDLIKSAYDMAIIDFPEQVEYYRKALEAIATERSSAVLKDHLAGSAQGDNDTTGKSDEPVGLDNIGNTCYLNSLLQFLFTLVELRQIVLDFDQYKMDATEDNIRDKKVGQRNITKREVQTAQNFVANLGVLFQGMIQTPSSTIRPEKELARLTLESTSAMEKVRRRSTLMSDRPNLGSLDSQAIIPSAPITDKQQTEIIVDGKTVQSPLDGDFNSMNVEETMSDPVPTPPTDNSSEATLVSRPATPNTPAMDIETIEQQRELLNNKENLSPTKLDISPKHGDIEMIHPEPLAPASPSKVNIQAAALASLQKEPIVETSEVAETTQYAPPPGKPPPVPPRKPLEPTTDILEEYAKQQDVTEVIAHCIFQFSCAMRGTGKDPSGEQRDEVHDMFFGQTARRTVPEKGEPILEPFNSVVGRVATKPKDVYEAIDNNYDLLEREDGSTSFESITKLPPVFSVALDRVAWDNDAKRAVKRDDFVQVPETIFLDRYLEAPPESELMQRRKQAWAMKTELASLTKRRDLLEEKVANGRDKPTLFADAKRALEYLQDNPDFSGPDSPFGEFANELAPTANILGAIAEDLLTESRAVSARMEHLQQQLKESFADMRKHPYRLHAAFFHRGGASGGHYWVFIYDHSKECWRKYNDERVNIVENLNDIFGKPNGTYATPNPYLLVYVREDELSRLVQTVKREIVWPTPDGLPPDHATGGTSNWQTNQPQSQIQALPPHETSREMVEINGGIGAWAGGESSDWNEQTRAPQDDTATWDDSELIDNRHVNWSR